MLPTLKLGRSIKVDRKCFGVHVVENHNYMSCHNNLGKGEILVLDMNSSVKHRLELSGMLEDHIYVTCHNNPGKGEVP